MHRHLNRIDSITLPIVEGLFDQLPRSPFFVKDASLRYVAANAAMLLLCGVKVRSALIGKSARDFFPEALSRRYEALDRQVLRTGKPIKDRLDLSLRAGEHPEWLLFTRWPVVAADGAVIGVAAAARSLDAPDRRHPTYQRLALAADYMQQNFAAPLRLNELAKRAAVSASQLKRDFVSVFGLSPQRYLERLRIDAALERLRGSASIASIAHACGYADQSAFTRRFHIAVGMTPRQYRAAHA